MSHSQVTKPEVLAALDDIFELPIGTLTGDEMLSTLQWDSLAVVSYIATCHGLVGVVLKGENVKAAKSIQDLLALIKPHIAD